MSTRFFERLIRVAVVVSSVMMAAPATAQTGDGFFLSRFSGTGEFDGSFGNNARWYFATSWDPGYAIAAARDTQNRIVVAGTQNFRFAVARFTADGSPDSQFGPSGQAFATFPEGAEASAVAIRPDGSILVAGTASGTFAIACFTATGQACSGWGFATAQTAFSYPAEGGAIAVAADNSFVVAGKLHVPGERDEMFALARYKPWGSVDSAFGQAGRVVLNKAPGVPGLDLDHWNYESFHAVRFDTSGRIVAAGEFSSVSQYYRRMVVMRFFGNGSIDASFGQGGMATAGGCTWAWGCLYDAVANSMAIDSSGRIVLGGGSTYGASLIDLPVDLALARFLPTGALDTTFGTGGMVHKSLGAPSWIQSIELSGNTIYVAGAHNGLATAFIGRYDSTGALDTTFGGSGLLIGSTCGYGGFGVAVVVQIFTVPPSPIGNLTKPSSRYPVLVGACVKG